MLGLNRRATLHRRTGVARAKPAFESEGAPFRCRVELTRGAAASGSSRENTHAARIFAEPIDAAPGDKIILDDDTVAFVAAAARREGAGGVHHEEIEVFFDE